MQAVFWILLAITVIYCVFVIIREKFSIELYVLLGVILPLVMYFWGWSDKIVDLPTDHFYLIFIYLFIILIVSRLFCVKARPIHLSYSLTKYSKYFWVVNVIYIVSYLFECYLICGDFIPAIHHIDIHTKNYPFILYITSSIFAVEACNLLIFKETKRKSYLIWMIAVLLTPVAVKNARMISLMAGVQILSMALAMSSKNTVVNLIHKLKHALLNKKRLVVLFWFLLCSIVLIEMINLTEVRMNQYGKYNFNYSKVIGYTGPSILGNDKVLSVYYGYFPLSFNNLNLNIKYREIHPNYIGLYSFKSVYYGLLQFDNVFDMDAYAPETNAYVTSTSATVPTAYWDYYYDYSVYCFIPMLLSAALSVYIRNQMYTRDSVWHFTLFYAYIPLWFFTSFQNELFGSTLIFNIVIMYFLLKILTGSPRRTQDLPHP